MLVICLTYVLHSHIIQSVFCVCIVVGLQFVQLYTKELLTKDSCESKRWGAEICKQSVARKPED